ncbi:hypothetical protein CDAR_20761 [Caerostris darwini]|uniref:Uncharacterized protein n=1 Tax=Caerostris darwini TaxID=1538125 RepID=A0AAV4QD21_9ARAC|nr:hypothetical protein CDAR_20761 [Caerostris darwini]
MQNNTRSPHFRKLSPKAVSGFVSLQSELMMPQKEDSQIGGEKSHLIGADGLDEIVSSESSEKRKCGLHGLLCCVSKSSTKDVYGYSFI